MMLGITGNLNSCREAVLFKVSKLLIANCLLELVEVYNIPAIAAMIHRESR